ncbi:MAG: FecR domain-containing protein [bacterium]
MRIKLLFIISVATLLVIPLYTFAQKPQEAVKLGDITLSSGEVLVRTKGKWSALKTVPHPLFSTDKVVTRRGRAEINLIDTGIIRLDIDSNLSIVEKKERKGVLVRKTATVRQVNVLLGTAWFDIKVQKNKKVRFKAPHLTAGIRGTSGKIEVDVEGAAKFGLASGDADMIGDFKPIPLPRPITPSHIKTKNLPPSNPRADNSPLQKAAKKNLETHEKAAYAASRAGQYNKMAKKARSHADRAKTEILKKQAAHLKADASVAQSKSALEQSKAHLATAEEALLEAERLGDTSARIAAIKTLEHTTRILNGVEKRFSEVKSVASEVKAIDNVSSAMAKAAVAETKASVSSADAATIKAASSVVVAHTSGDEDVVVSAEKALQKTQQVVIQVENLSLKVEEVAERVETSSEEVAESIALATEVIAKAALVNTSNAEAIAEVAVNVVANDSGTLEKVEIAVTKIEQVVTTMDMAAENVLEAAATGNILEVELIVNISDQAIDQAETIIGGGVLEGAEELVGEEPGGELPDEVVVDEIVVDEVVDEGQTEEAIDEGQPEEQIDEGELEYWEFDETQQQEEDTTYTPGEELEEPALPTIPESDDLNTSSPSS